MKKLIVEIDSPGPPTSETWQNVLVTVAVMVGQGSRAGEFDAEAGHRVNFAVERGE